MKLSGLNISGENAKKLVKSRTRSRPQYKCKALYGSCSVNISLRSSLGVRREEIGKEEGGGESRDWNLNGRLAKLLSEIRRVADAKEAKFPKFKKAFFAWVY